MLKIETDRLSVGLYIIAVAGVLRLRDQNKNKCQEGQKSQNYLIHDCCQQNENDIRTKDDTDRESA